MNTYTSNSLVYSFHRPIGEDTFEDHYPSRNIENMKVNNYLFLFNSVTMTTWLYRIITANKHISNQSTDN